jgi:membrane dipeptidase
VAPSADVLRLHEEAPLVDAHAHPSLKAYLFGRNLWRHYRSGGAFDPFSSRTDFRMLEEGGVGAVWAAHYPPERKLFEDCFLMGLAAFFTVPVYLRIVRRPPFEILLAMMDALEREAARRPHRTEIARSPEDLERIRREGKIALVHAVEGAHVLEGRPGRLDELARRGVAVLTLAHFYANGLVEQTDGISTGNPVRKLCDLDFGSVRPPLTGLGREVVQRCERLGIVLDVTHCSPAAREAVYGATDPGRPLVATHVGVRAVRDTPYNLSDDEIREIAGRGGAVGVIFMPWWLTGVEEGPGLEAVWETMAHLRDVCDSWDHVMIGTDFDGFTDPPDELRDASQLPALTELLLERGVAEEEVRKVLGGNAMRVLRAGWSGAA